MERYGPSKADITGSSPVARSTKRDGSVDELVKSPVFQAGILGVQVPSELPDRSEFVCRRS